MKEIDLIRSEVIHLFENSEDERDKDLHRKLVRATINNFFDFLEEKFDERITYLAEEL